jgi:hypothetical protein
MSYPNERICIEILFDIGSPKQAALFRAFRASFGEGYVTSEDLDPPRYRCVNLLPGGAQEVLR